MVEIIKRNKIQFLIEPSLILSRNHNLNFFKFLERSKKDNALFEIYVPKFFLEITEKDSFFWEYYRITTIKTKKIVLEKIKKLRKLVNDNCLFVYGNSYIQGDKFKDFLNNLLSQAIEKDKFILLIKSTGIFRELKKGAKKFIDFIVNEKVKDFKNFWKCLSSNFNFDKKFWKTFIKNLCDFIESLAVNNLKIYLLGSLSVLFDFLKEYYGENLKNCFEDFIFSFQFSQINQNFCN